MEFPRIFLYDATANEEDAAAELALRVAEMGLEAPFVVCGVHGERLGSRLSGIHQREAPIPDANQEWAAALGHRAHRQGADCIVAIGGGRCLDVGKLAAARAGLVMIAVPTQLSHDGLCSPVAVVPDGAGHRDSVGAIAPKAVFLSLPTLTGAPAESVRAGIGDLLANPLALRDWDLAVRHGLEETNERAWELSVESFELIEPYLEADPAQSAQSPEFLRRLADALVLSGLAMITAGTSRPASGAEHEISHAIDMLFGGRAMHGAQVAFGCIFSAALYGDDADAFRKRLEILGLPHLPGRLGLGEDDLIEMLLRAPDTRPGRFTILEDAALDEAGARALVRKIWRPA